MNCSKTLYYNSLPKPIKWTHNVVLARKANPTSSLYSFKNQPMCLFKVKTTSGTINSKYVYFLPILIMKHMMTTSKFQSLNKEYIRTCYISIIVLSIYFSSHVLYNLLNNIYLCMYVYISCHKIINSGIFKLTLPLRTASPLVAPASKGGHDFYTHIHFAQQNTHCLV